MVIAIALPGFNDLGRPVTRIVLLMGHLNYRFSTFSARMKKSYRLEVWMLLQNAPSNSVLFSFSPFICEAVSNSLWRFFFFTKTLATYGKLVGRNISRRAHERTSSWCQRERGGFINWRWILTVFDFLLDDLHMVFFFWWCLSSSNIRLTKSLPSIGLKTVM